MPGCARAFDWLVESRERASEASRRLKAAVIAARRRWPTRVHPGPDCAPVGLVQQRSRQERRQDDDRRHNHRHNMATAHVPQLTNRQVKAALGNDGSRYGIQLSRLQSRMRSEGIQRRLMRWGVLLDSVWVAEALYTENRLHIEPTNPTSKHKCEFTLTGTEEGETSPELLKTAAKKLVQRIDLALFGCSLCGDIPRLEPSDVPVRALPGKAVREGPQSADD